MKSFLIFTLVFFISMSFSTANAADSTQRYIITYKEGVTNSNRANVTNSKNRIQTWTNGEVLKLNSNQVKQLKNNPAIKAIEIDQPVYINDIQLNSSWGLDRSDQRSPKYDTMYHYNYTGYGVTAYVIDTGVRASHIEFEGRASFAKNFTGDGKDTDCHGHGTFVSGIIASKTYGVAKEANIVGLKVLGCNGIGFTSGIIAALNWVMNNHNGPSIINISTGGSYSQALNDAINSTVDAGIPVVVAAGNNNKDACAYSPSSASEAITVGAINNNTVTNGIDTKSTFSNYGSCVDMFAPGQYISSLWARSDIDKSSGNGTSYSSPHVAGAIALLMEEFPNENGKSITDRLLNNTTNGIILNTLNEASNKLLYIGTSSIPPTTNYTLTVNKNVGGTIINTNKTINCGTLCSAVFKQNTIELVTAIPDPGYKFVGWTGNCTTLNTTCSIKMDNNKNIVAEFQKELTYATITINKIGNGTVTSSVAIYCGNNCSQTVPIGTIIEFIAIPDSGYTLSSLDSKCTVRGNNSCTIIVNSNINLVFEFKQAPVQPINDLSVEQIVLIPTQNNTFTIQTVIKNNGNTVLTNQVIDLFLNQSQTQSCGSEGNTTTTITSINPNESKTIEVTGLKKRYNGAAMFRVVVDSMCQISETSENNNQLGYLYNF